MVLTKDDKALIKSLFSEWGWRGRRFVKEFPGKKWCHTSIDRFIKKIIQTGSSDRKTGSGRPKTVRTTENIEACEEVIASQEDNPGTHLSQRKAARHIGINRSGVQRIIKHDLKFKSFKRLRTSRKTDQVKAKRKTRARKLLDRFSSEEVKSVVFTDEKDFTLEIPTNSKNDVVYGKKKSEIPLSRLYHEQNRFSKKVMVSAGVSWNGKTGIYFLDTQTVKVTAERYVDLLQEHLLPDCVGMYPNNNFIFQQDGATCHTANLTQNFLSQQPNRFIKKDEWPPMSPDVNPMDYAIWPALMDKVYHQRRAPFTEDELKQKILDCWELLTIEEMRNAIKKWKKRLRAIVEADGNSTEHLRM